MKIKSTIKDQNGGAVIEFAIVLPLLILLFAGITEFSVGFYNHAVITNASREGARAAIGLIPGDVPDPDAYIIDKVNVYCFGEDVDSDGYGDSPRLITFGNDISEFSKCASTPVPPCIEINDGSPWVDSEPDGYYDADDLKVDIEYVYTFLLIPSFAGFNPTITLKGQTVMDMF